MFIYKNFNKIFKIIVKIIIKLKNYKARVKN